MTTQLSASNPRAAVDHVIELLLNNVPLYRAVKEAGLSLKTFHNYLASDKLAGADYARARELRADVLVDQALEIADNEPDAAKARNQIEIRKWTATKHNAKTYGDRIDLNVTQTLDISGTLLEARNRLRPVSDQSNVIDAQVVDSIDVSPVRPLDKQSISRVIDAPVEGAEPDIFS